MSLAALISVIFEVFCFRARGRGLRFETGEAKWSAGLGGAIQVSHRGLTVGKYIQNPVGHLGGSRYLEQSGHDFLLDVGESVFLVLAIAIPRLQIPDFGSRSHPDHRQIFIQTGILA